MKHETHRCMVEMRYTYKSLVVNFECKKAVLKSRLRWDGNIKIGLEVTGCDDMDCIYLV